MERLGELLKIGELKDIVAIPTSIRTKEQAEELGIPLVTLDTHSGEFRGSHALCLCGVLLIFFFSHEVQYEVQYDAVLFRWSIFLTVQQ